jgi:DNA-binding transcriptional ArsR family regulator
MGYPDPLLDEIAGRFRLLSEPLRLKLLATLAHGERSVGELVTMTGANQPNVSKHLAILAQGGLVSRRKMGTTAYYTLADSEILTLCDTVCAGIQHRYTLRARELGLAETSFEGERAAPARDAGPQGTA